MTDVKIERGRRAGLVLLDRPKALNALTIGMVEAIAEALRSWSVDVEVEHVVIASTSGAFCAGGDMRQVRTWAMTGRLDLCDEFFATEYAMNAQIHAYAKPVTSLIGGVCMGGGIGLSAYGRYRVAATDAVFAMPETAIGFFPDVGASWLLPRLARGTGLLLGLTGSRFSPLTALATGLISHVVETGSLGRLQRDLIDAPSSALSGILDAASAPAGADAVFEELATVAEAVFPADAVARVVERLQAIPGGQAQLVEMQRRSPRALATTLALMNLGSGSTLVEALMRERAAAAAAVGSHDFQEGVRAVLVDKDGAPRWEEPPTA